MNDYKFIKEVRYNEDQQFENHVRSLTSNVILSNRDNILELLQSEDYLQIYTGLEAMKMQLKNQILQVDDLSENEENQDVDWQIFMENMNLIPTFIQVAKQRWTFHHIKLALHILVLFNNSCKYLSLKIINQFQKLKQYKIYEISFNLGVLTKKFLFEKNILNINSNIELSHLFVELAQFSYSQKKGMKFYGCILNLVDLINYERDQKHIHIATPALCASLMFVSGLSHFPQILEVLQAFSLLTEGAQMIEQCQIESQLVSCIQNMEISINIRRLAINILIALARFSQDSKIRILSTKILQVATQMLKDKNGDLKQITLELLIVLSGQSVVNYHELMLLLSVVIEDKEKECYQIMLASVKSLDTRSCEKLIQYNYLSKCELILSKRINTLYKLMIESLGHFFQKASYVLLRQLSGRLYKILITGYYMNDIPSEIKCAIKRILKQYQKLCLHQEDTKQSKKRKV